MTKTHFVAKSGNSKTGIVAATYRERTSCPSSCPMLERGCYAAGRIEGVARKYGESGDAWVERAIADTPHGSVFRHLVVGDLMNGDAPDWQYLAGIERLATERPDISLHIVYTHGWRHPALAEWMRQARERYGIVVNASTQTESEAWDASRAGLLPVIVLTGEDDPLIGRKIDGRKVVVCPAQTHGKTCEECRLCGKGGNKRAVVGFIAHGSGAKGAAASTGR